MKKKVPWIVVILLLILSLAGNWHLQKNIKNEQTENTKLKTKNKEQKKELANYEATQIEKQTSTNESESQQQNSPNKTAQDVSDNLESLIVLLYSSKNKSLNDRYKKFEPLITGEAVNQLKPKDDTDNDDTYINVPNEINNIVVYPKVENGEYSAIATYDMKNKIDKKTYTNHMIMNVNLTEKEGEMLISKINFNSGINN